MMILLLYTYTNCVSDWGGVGGGGDLNEFIFTFYINCWFYDISISITISDLYQDVLQVQYTSSMLHDQHM